MLAISVLYPLHTTFHTFSYTVVVLLEQMESANSSAY